MTKGAPLGRTAQAFKSLSTEARAKALHILDNLRHDEIESPIERSIALALLEVHRVIASSYPKIISEIEELQQQVGAVADTLDAKNLGHFATRRTNHTREEQVGLVALYVVNLIETDGERPKKKLSPWLYDEQKRHLDWVGQALRTGIKPDFERFAAPAGPGSARADAPATFLETLRQIVDAQMDGMQSNEQVHSLLTDDKDVRQVSFVAFRSALTRPRRIVQSYLTLLPPSRNRTPFWTFAHLYAPDGQLKVRTAGGIVLTTRNTLYLVGGEAWLDAKQLKDADGINRHLRPTSLTAFAFPLETINDRATLLRGIALTTNSKGSHIVSRVALRRSPQTTFEGTSKPIEVEAFESHLRKMVDQGVIDFGRQIDPQAEGGAFDALIRDEARSILEAVNNQPDSQYLDGALRADRSQPVEGAKINRLVQKQFADPNDDPLWVGPNGDDYHPDLHRWFNALSSKR